MTSVTLKNTCSICNEKIEKFIEKKSFKIPRMRSPDNTHFHYGIAFYEYGICNKHHYSRFSRTKVIWDPCIKCKFQGITKYKDIRTVKNEEIEALKDEMKKIREELHQYKKQQDSEISQVRSEISKKEKILDLDSTAFDLTDLIKMCDTSSLRNKLQEENSSIQDTKSIGALFEDIDEPKEIPDLPSHLSPNLEEERPTEISFSKFRRRN